MLADRRDFIVATYSSVRGTGARSTASTFTGSAFGAAACFASVLSHPVLEKTTALMTSTEKTAAIFWDLFMQSPLLPWTLTKKRCGMNWRRFKNHSRLNSQAT